MVSDLQTHVGFWLRHVSNHVSAGFRQLVEAEGVSVSEWVALRALYGTAEASAAELIAALGMTKGAISKIVGRLEEKGLVRRRPVPQDERAHALVLTPAGRALVPRLAALADQNDARWFGHLSARARAELVRQMREIARVHRLTDVPVD